MKITSENLQLILKICFLYVNDHISIALTLLNINMASLLESLDKNSLLHLCTFMGLKRLHLFKQASSECSSIVDEVRSSPLLMGNLLIRKFGVEEALVRAVKAGIMGIGPGIELIKYIVECWGIHEKNTAFWKSLNMAADVGHVKIVKYLLDSFGLDRSSRYQRSPYEITGNVACKRYYEVLKMLVRARVDIVSEHDALHMAAISRDVELVEEIMNEGGANIHYGDNVALMTAVRNKDIDMVRCLLRHGADVNGGNGAIFVAAINIGDVGIVKDFLMNGVRVERILDNAILSPIMKGNLEIVELLLDIGIGNGYEVALKTAVIQRNIDMVKLLLDKGADPLARSGEAFCWAAYKGCIDVLQLFLDYGVDPSTSNSLALRWALEKNNAAVVEFLLKKGARVDESVIETAFMWADEEIQQILVTYSYPSS